MSVEALAGSVFVALEEGRLDVAVSRCLRLARMSDDYLHLALFARLSFTEKYEAERTVVDAMEGRALEAVEFVMETSNERWLELLAVSEGPSRRVERSDRTVLIVAASAIADEVDQAERQIEDLRVPPQLGAYDAAEWSHRYREVVRLLRHRIRMLQQIRTRVSFVCESYAGLVERHARTASKATSFLEVVQRDVNSYFRDSSPTTFAKLETATSLLAATDPESAALLLTEVRRTLNAVADFLYPPCRRRGRVCRRYDAEIGTGPLLEPPEGVRCDVVRSLHCQSCRRGGTRLHRRIRDTVERVGEQGSPWGGDLRRRTPGAAEPLPVLIQPDKVGGARGDEGATLKVRRGMTQAFGAKDGTGIPDFRLAPLEN